MKQLLRQMGFQPSLYLRTDAMIWIIQPLEDESDTMMVKNVISRNFFLCLLLICLIKYRV